MVASNDCMTEGPFACQIYTFLPICVLGNQIANLE